MKSVGFFGLVFALYSVESGDNPGWIEYLTLGDKSTMMSMQRTKKLLTPILLIGLLASSSVWAKGKKRRRNSIHPALLKKVLKKKPTSQKTKETHSYFNVDLLNSRFGSWGISPKNKNSSINLLGAWKQFKQKKEIVVAVIDTGIDPHHPFLANNLYVPQGQVSTNNFGLDFSKNKSNKSRPSDSHGHGTHVSGIVKSVFPSVKILTLKYYNPKASGQDNLTSTIRALKYAIDSNVDIINYSGGGPEPALEELRVLKMAEKKGILVVAAAGNEESNIDNRDNAYYPASYGLKNIITVTAHDQKLKLLSSSNYGKNSVDLAAPGYRIRSAYPHSRAGYLTGTSQATAFVTGVAALMKSQYPNLSATQIKQIINQSSKKEITLTTRCLSGGRLDAEKAMTLANQVATGRAKRSLANKTVKQTKEQKQGKIFYRLAN